MDTRHGWIPDDLGYYITRRHPLLRLCDLRGDSDQRHLHCGIGSCGCSPLPRYWHGSCKLRERSGERRRRSQRNNLPDDVPRWNLLATWDIAGYHEDHSQLHAADLCERWTKRRVDLCSTSPSTDQHHHSAGLSSVFHRTGQPTNELEGRIAAAHPPEATSGSGTSNLRRVGIFVKASFRATNRVE